ncbi:hypothetical protein ABXN37_25990 [Piscinibacter sakaiensis]|uniref:hypothetical protein n=1 Tax=Piscinibacter sakaiensis TaxID=1547922 RepID=UPI00372C70A9
MAALEPALAQAEQEADPGLRVTLGNQLMRMRHAVGDHAGARALGERVLAQSEPLEMGVVFRADVMHVVAMIEVAAGQAPAGLARFEALLARLAARAPRPGSAGHRPVYVRRAPLTRVAGDEGIGGAMPFC